MPEFRGLKNRRTTNLEEDIVDRGFATTSLTTSQKSKINISETASTTPQQTTFTKTTKKK